MCGRNRQRMPFFTRAVRDWLTIAWMCVVMVSGEAAETCPAECACSWARGRAPALRVTCARGDMRAIPVDLIDRSAEVIHISAPPDKPNFLTIGPIFTQPTPFVNLRELHIVNSNVPSIGQYSFWGLHNLRLINLTHNNLTSIGTDNFRGLINLTDLHLEHNDIEQMPSETFRHLTALRNLVLANNQISSLVPRLFRMLAKLLFLDLSYNPLEDLNPEVFKDIQQLRVFKCRRCLIPRINTQIYHLVPLLEELDLGENQFKYLTSDEFISLKKLKMLKLDGNQLSVIVDNMFGMNRQLLEVRLARNRLALLAPAALANLSALAHLDISHNKIDRFHLQTFAPVVDSLRSINFSGNNAPLNEIAIVLQILPEIRSVGMANLSLESLPQNFFTYNEHLTALDLSWNKFTTFPYKLLMKTKFLQSLDLSRNKLETLTEDDLQRLEAIAHVSLARNNWRCDGCAVGPMLAFMATSVLNATLRGLRCLSPPRLIGVSLAELGRRPAEGCTGAGEAGLGAAAGLALLCAAALAAGAGALCCSRRRAHYYTHEDKRRGDSDHPDGLLPTDCGSVATIHAPYHLVTKGS